jgi:cholesterol transport system auxiliary component
MSGNLRRLALAACASLACLLHSGCALFGKSDPVVERYFTPMDDAAPAPAAQRPQGHLELHLGRVEGWSHLRERMVVRSSSQELVYSDGRHWTERPEVYLRRALSQALFEERGVVEVLSGRALTLEVELSAFEEIEKPHLARLQASFLLHDQRLALLQETVIVDQPVEPAKAGEEQRALVFAFSQVLHGAVEQIAAKVVARLGAESAATAPAQR